MSPIAVSCALMARMRVSIRARRLSVIGIAYLCYTFKSPMLTRRHNDAAMDSLVECDLDAAPGVLETTQLYVVRHRRGGSDSAHRSAGGNPHRAGPRAESLLLRPATRSLPPRGGQTR